VDQARDSAQATAVTSAVSPRSTPGQHWLARLSLGLVGLAVVFVAVFAELKSLTMLAVGLAGAAVSLASAFFFLSRRGVWRWLSLAVFVLTPIAVIAVFALRNLLWVAVVAAAIWLLASMTARFALARDHQDWRMPERPAEPPARHPYLIMNPKSGGGKVEKFDLKRKAEDLGAEVFLIGGSEPVGVKVRNVQQAVDLLRGRRAVGLRVLSTKKIEITADAPQIPVGVDGEALSMSTPVVCAISPGALRVWVPRDRPGVAPPKPPINWVRLWHLAGIHRERAEEAG
jgi:hypothetical protein